MGLNNKLTENQFNAVKILLRGGAAVAEAADYMKLSENTIRRIKSSETFRDYQQMLAEIALSMSRARAAKKAKAEKAKADHEPKPVEPEKKTDQEKKAYSVPQAVTMMPSHEAREWMRKQTELLTLISDKLAYIVEMLS